VFSSALFFFGLLIETHHGEGRGVRSWEQNVTVGSGFNASNFVKKNGLVLLLQSVFCSGILSKSGSCLNLTFSSGTDIFSRLIYGFAMFVVLVITFSAVVDLIVYARGSFLMQVYFRVLQWHI
jgi:hypothetical protein